MRRERVPFAMAGSGSACRQDQWAEPLWPGVGNVAYRHVSVSLPYRVGTLTWYADRCLVACLVSCLVHTTDRSSFSLGEQMLPHAPLSILLLGRWLRAFEAQPMAGDPVGRNCDPHPGTAVYVEHVDLIARHRAWWYLIGIQIQKGKGHRQRLRTAGRRATRRHAVRRSRSRSSRSHSRNLIRRRSGRSGG